MREERDGRKNQKKEALRSRQVEQLIQERDDESPHCYQGTPLTRAVQRAWGLSSPDLGQEEEGTRRESTKQQQQNTN